MASHVQIGIAASRLGYAAYVANRMRTNDMLRQMPGLAPATIRRIHFYTIQSAVTNLWFSTLRGQPPSEAEQRMALRIGALTPLIDDAMDEQGLSGKDLEQRLRSGEDPAFTPAAKLLAGIEAEGSPILKHMMMKTLAAQDDSGAQQQPTQLTAQQLQQLTAAKGGFATLLYRHILTNPVGPEEEAAIHLLGFLLQMTNDAFDVYKDYHAGIQTMFTHTTDIQPLRELFLETIEAMKKAFRATPYRADRVEKLLHQTILVVTRGLVAIDQLCQRQQERGGSFHVADFERKALICDMELASNIWKTWQYSRRLC